MRTERNPASSARRAVSRRKRGPCSSVARKQPTVARLLPDDRAAALPPLRPAFFFCAVVPPWDELPPDPDVLPPRLDAPGELAIRAARCLDMPLSLRASYCFSFLTLARFDGMGKFLSSSSYAYPGRRGAKTDDAAYGRRIVNTFVRPATSRTLKT